MLTIDTLAQEIRRVDGNHSLGAGALAEALMPFISAALSIEQAEPVAEPAWWLVATDMGKVIFNGHDKARAERVSESQGRPITPLYAHPPVSALVNAQADADVVERWQPIETAPHSKQVLVFVPRGDQPKNLPVGSWHIAYQTEPAPPLAQTWRYSNGQFRGEQIGWPTHWMPLPEPPALSSLRPTEVGSATDTKGTE